MDRIERAMTLAYMGQLISDIEQLLDDENNHQNFVCEGYLDRNQTTGVDLKINQMIDELDTLADGLLITSKGQPYFAAHEQLSRLCGVCVRAGEKDSFGWLTGVIVARNFKFVYG